MCGFNFRCTNSSGAQRSVVFKRCAKIERRASADPVYRMAAPKLRRLLYRKADDEMVFSER